MTTIQKPTPLVLKDGKWVTPKQAPVPATPNVTLPNPPVSSSGVPASRVSGGDTCPNCSFCAPNACGWPQAEVATKTGPS